VFHAGTTLLNNEVVTSGGRVLSVTSYGTTMDEALENTYKNIEQIEFEDSYYRKDIGADLRDMSK
jgi:phosphoribosylamine--glycine ligase